MATVYEIVYDSNLLLELLTKAPQTYNTILKHEINNKTLHRICVRKIANLIRDGLIGRSEVPLSPRYSYIKKILFLVNKKYRICFTYSRIEIDCYYFTDFVHDKQKVKIKNAHKLVFNEWVEVGNITVDVDKIIKWL